MKASEITTVDGAATVRGAHAFTVGELAERYVVKQHVILALIRAGELQALNIAKPGAKRPHWRIMPDMLTAFEQRRAAVPADTPPKRRKKQKAGLEIIDPETGKVNKKWRAVGSGKAALDSN